MTLPIAISGKATPPSTRGAATFSLSTTAVAAVGVT
ncbi:Uncharacterised protein [Vibrio cholerae]|nr:Uncharacterised protein [Vibrio cholerae]